MYLQMQDTMWYMLAIQQGYIVAEVSMISKEYLNSWFKRYNGLHIVSALKIDFFVSVLCSTTNCICKWFHVPIWMDKGI